MPSPVVEKCASCNKEYLPYPGDKAVCSDYCYEQLLIWFGSIAKPDDKRFIN